MPPGPLGRQKGLPARLWRTSASATGWRNCQPGNCRQASADGWPWPPCSHAGRCLWLLDEPHAGLDAEHRELLDRLLKEVAAGGATVVLASHEILTREVLADRVATVSGGMVMDGLLVDNPPLDPAIEAPGTGNVVQPDLEQPSVA